MTDCVASIFTFCVNVRSAISGNTADTIAGGCAAGAATTAGASKLLKKSSKSSRSAGFDHGVFPVLLGTGCEVRDVGKDACLTTSGLVTSVTVFSDGTAGAHRRCSYF